MRTRLSRTERRVSILKTARKLFQTHGYSNTEMEDIRLACDISRGGLYHHFENKRAILDALIEDDIAGLVPLLTNGDGSPIRALLEAGSRHLGAAPGVLETLQDHEDKLDYLSGLERAVTNQLATPLRDRLTHIVRPDVDAGHVAEMFLTINSHINRREILGQWTDRQAAGFAATALNALASLMADASELAPLIEGLKAKAGEI